MLNIHIQLRSTSILTPYTLLDSKTRIFQLFALSRGIRFFVIKIWLGLYFLVYFISSGTSTAIQYNVFTAILCVFAVIKIYCSSLSDALCPRHCTSQRGEEWCKVVWGQYVWNHQWFKNMFLIQKLRLFSRCKSERGVVWKRHQEKGGNGSSYSPPERHGTCSFTF